MFRELNSLHNAVGALVRNSRLQLADLPATTEQADAMSADLKRRGFKFIGPTICYAFMQATGMVNDHVVDCFRYGEINAMGR
jgi:DNA-3-methyladenine glycosylase I